MLAGSWTGAQSDPNITAAGSQHDPGVMPAGSQADRGKMLGRSQGKPRIVHGGEGAVSVLPVGRSGRVLECLWADPCIMLGGV